MVTMASDGKAGDVDEREYAKPLVQDNVGQQPMKELGLEVLR